MAVQKKERFEDIDLIASSQRVVLALNTSESRNDKMVEVFSLAKESLVGRAKCSLLRRA